MDSIISMFTHDSNTHPSNTQSTRSLTNNNFEIEFYATQKKSIQEAVKRLTPDDLNVKLLELFVENIQRLMELLEEKQSYQQERNLNAHKIQFLREQNHKFFVLAESYEEKCNNLEQQIQQMNAQIAIVQSQLQSTPYSNSPAVSSSRASLQPYRPQTTLTNTIPHQKYFHQPIHHSKLNQTENHKENMHSSYGKSNTQSKVNSNVMSNAMSNVTSNVMNSSNQYRKMKIFE